MIQAAECFECRAPAQHMHHVVPRSQGGTKVLPLCAQCHAIVHGMGMAHPDLTRRAMDKRRAEGKVVGSVPYGWQRDGDRLVPCEQEREMIAAVAECAGYRFTLREIADELFARGYRNRRGNTFNPNTIAALLQHAEAAA
jgi:hypothetical protein